MPLWNLEKYAGNIAVFGDGSESLTYGDLSVATQEIAAQTDGRCLVFCLCRNHIGSLLGYVAFINHGIVPLMLDAHIDDELLTCLMATYRPDYLWLPTDIRNRVPQYARLYSCWGYDLVKTDYRHEYPLFDELALLITTSGSTGSRKLVRQSYANIRANIESIVSYLELDESERTITTLPMNYTYGLSIINTHLHIGASLVITGATLVEKPFWQRFREHSVTSFGGVPFTYELLNNLRFFKMDLPSLRTMTQAGGRLGTMLHRKFAEHARDSGRRFFVMYGQTEATARMSYLPPAHAVDKCGSIGIAIPGGSFSLADEQGNEIAADGVAGELIYQGENVALGYAECGEDLANGDERHGRLATGDIAMRDADGYYSIVGRKKRFLKIFGNRINLDETEHLLKSRFADAEFVCGGVDDKMCIYVTDGAPLDEVKHFVAEKSGLNHAAFVVKAIAAIPRNESGKVIYDALAAC
jgi:long-chain acyl-CoA synthetase